MAPEDVAKVLSQ
jgi:hypothetical protein